MEDQVTCIFRFKIIPTKIVQNLTASKTNSNSPPSSKNVEQSILFKLGNSEGKCSKLNEQVEIKTSVLYSKTLNKFCPIKGLVKIYDRNKDGQEMISCVGAFNTDQLLNSKKWRNCLANEGALQDIDSSEQVQLVRNIGSCLLTMKVMVVREVNNSENKTMSINTAGNIIKQRVISTPTVSPPRNIKRKADDHKIESSKAQTRIYQKPADLQTQLKQEVSKNSKLQQKLKNKNAEISQFINKFKKFTELLKVDRTVNNLEIEANSKKKQLTIQYNEKTINGKEEFEQFIKFISAEVEYHSSVGADKIPDSPRIQQYDRLQYQIRKLSQESKTLQGMNQYLQEKDHQMQSIIQQKQMQIQNMKKIVHSSNQQLDFLEEKNHEQGRIIENLELTVDEIKEEIANLSEIIENYRRKYGDLKEVKDRALQRDLRECLHWIDQYREDQLSMVEQQATNNSINQTSMNSNSGIILDSQSNNTMTSLMMKSIDHIQDMPVEEISQIRREVINVLKRLDQLLARSNL